MIKFHNLLRIKTYGWGLVTKSMKIEPLQNINDSTLHVCHRVHFKKCSRYCSLYVLLKTFFKCSLFTGEMGAWLWAVHCCQERDSSVWPALCWLWMEQSLPCNTPRSFRVRMMNFSFRFRMYLLKLNLIYKCS